MVHKSMAYRAEVSWYLKILLIKHSRARSDEQELEKKTRNSLPVKNILAVKNWNFLTGLWKHLAINHMETHLSLLYFFFPRTKRVAFFIYLPFFFFFPLKIRLEGKSNEIISWLYQWSSCVTEKSVTLHCGKKNTTFFLHLISLWRTWDLGHWGPYSGFE